MSLKKSNNEIWVDALGFEKYYQVSSLGRLKRKERKSRNSRNRNTLKTYKEKIITEFSTTSAGYYCAKLTYVEEGHGSI